MTAIDLALLIMRIVLGIIFMAHGAQKLFGWFGGSGITGTVNMLRNLGTAHPIPLAWMAAFSEFFGGVFVLFGLLTPLAAALIISTMITAIVTVHFKNGFFNGNRGYEFNLSLIALSLGLLLMGAGTVSLDHLLGFAVTFTQLPWWAMLVLVIVPFGGIVSTELSRRAKTASANNIGHKQGI